MNKRDLSKLRREFKLNSYMIRIKEVYSVYLKRGNGQVITKEKLNFNIESDEVKELYFNNFKRVLSGSIDSKIFELPIINGNTQQMLENVLNSNKDVNDLIDYFVDKIARNFNYENDVVINFIKAEYYMADKRDADKEDSDEYVHAVDFILCSINKVDIPKKVLRFDYSEIKFKSNSVIDLTINLNSPLDGFMFPSFCSDYVDMNKVIYYSSKPSKVNTNFVENVLGCNVKPSALEEKESFKGIMHETLGTVKLNVMQNIYESIYEKLDAEDDEEIKDVTLDMKDVSEVLVQNGVENTAVVKSAFEEVCGGDYSFKAKNILPDFYKKSIKIENETMSISVVPGMLGSIKQIRNKNGRKCLLIELNEDALINGIKLQTEK